MNEIFSNIEFAGRNPGCGVMQERQEVVMEMNQCGRHLAWERTAMSRGGPPRDSELKTVLEEFHDELRRSRRHSD